MELEDYESLPDFMPVAHIHDHCMEVLTGNEAVSSALAKLDVLADRQWHTYELPAPTLQKALREWLIRHWISADEEYLEMVLGLAYAFGLDKDIYRRALQDYRGEHVAEFENYLSMSRGDTMDPWCSLES